MATTSNKSKAKTKTAKKKTVKKTTVTKSTATKPAVKATKKVVKPSKTEAQIKATKPTVTVDNTKPFIPAAIVLLALAGFAAYFMKATTVQVFLGHLTKNELASTASTVLVAAAQPLCEVGIKWTLVGLLVISAVLVVLRATVWSAKENSGIKNGVQPMRWVDFGLTAAVAFQVTALVGGIQDFVALKLGAFVVVLLAYFAWQYERENAATGKPAKASLWGAKLSGLVVSLMLVATLAGTVVYGHVRSPWYAYALAAVFVAWLGATLYKLARTTKIGKHDYPSFDKSYDTISLIAKVVFAVVLIVGLYVKK